MRRIKIAMPMTPNVSEKELFSELHVSVFYLPLIRVLCRAGSSSPPTSFSFRLLPILLRADACSIGGMATTIGTPPNLVLAGFMADEFGSEHEPSFTEWFLMCAPLAFIMLLLTFMVIVLKWCRNLNISVPVDVATKQLTDLGDLTRDEKVVAFIQLAQIIFWFTRKESVPGSSVRVFVLFASLLMLMLTSLP